MWYEMDNTDKKIVEWKKWRLSYQNMIFDKHMW